MPVRVRPGDSMTAEDEQGAVYNVTLPVVALVRAASEKDALDKLAASLTRQGFEIMPESDSTTHDAFESEPLGFEPDPLPPWKPIPGAGDWR